MEPLLERSAIKERWQGLAPKATDSELAQIILKEIENIRQQADQERLRAVEKQHRAELEEQRRAEEERHKAEQERSRRRHNERLLIAVGVAFIAILVAIWENWQRATTAIYAADAEALIGAAASDRGAQMPPDLGARVVLRALSYINLVSEKTASRFFDPLSESVDNLLSNLSGLHLPKLERDHRLIKARSTFDSASRITLGQRFTVTRWNPERSISAEAIKCMPVKPAPAPKWTVLPRQPGDETQPNFRAFRIVGEGAGLRLNFGAVKKAGEVLDEDVDAAVTELWAALAAGARLCLSQDARVLVISSPGNNTPDVYELQWAPCNSTKKEDCFGLTWRVRAIPVLYAPGPVRADQRSFPCITSIIHLDNDKQTRASPSSFGRLQVEFSAEDSPANCTDQTKLSNPDKSYVAEYFTGLAAPRSVSITSAKHQSFVQCVSSQVNPEETVCEPRDVIHSNGGETSIKNDDLKGTAITIRKRKSEIAEPPILEVDFVDKNHSGIFAARRITLPANTIRMAALTDSGDVLLHDDADMIWSFVAATGSGQGKSLQKRDSLTSSAELGSERSGLEKRLWKRACPPSTSLAEAKAYLGELVDLEIDSACESMLK
ncbi:MAG: hypothetical protein L0Y50_11985 [Beijerinckiaceae bacterium]|nr:hypothetical protein [Beijerinckiaceae bacterium]